MSAVVTHDRTARRLEVLAEGVSCVLDYQIDDGVMTITHTSVPPEVGGRGIASALVQAALGAARDAGWRVVPACSYAATWMRRHPEDDDLRA